jgi:hypothetical protein
VPRGLVQLKGVTFRVGDANQPGTPAAIVLRSKLTRTLPASAEIGLGAKAAQLVIVQGTNFPCAAGTKVAQYRIEYEDGETAALELVYGRNVLAYSDMTASAQAPIVWVGKTAAGEAVALRVVVWENPQPEKAIRALTAEAGDAAGALMILGVTGLEGEVATCGAEGQPPRRQERQGRQECQGVGGVPDNNARGDGRKSRMPRIPTVRAP